MRFQIITSKIIYIYIYIYSTALGKTLGRLDFLTLVWQLVNRKENSEFNLVKLCLKIDLVSHPARTEGLVYIYIYIKRERERERERERKRERDYIEFQYHLKFWTSFLIKTKAKQKIEN